MTFLHPIYLAGALAAAVPILLHLLRRRTAVELPFSAVRLLERAPADQRLPRRLREWLLLALRVTALLLLALAFARPYFVGAAAPEGATIVAADVSYSLSAGGRFEAAREQARR
ncbi:MAG TPA: BatA domain-containing protein, partial [Vicinamibacterales bacterium]|nr:BatA domain-containing protein [Vicinamibacterales bacterium]